MLHAHTAGLACDINAAFRQVLHAIGAGIGVVRLVGDLNIGCLVRSGTNGEFETLIVHFVVMAERVVPRLIVIHRVVTRLGTLACKADGARVEEAQVDRNRGHGIECCINLGLRGTAFDQCLCVLQGAKIVDLDVFGIGVPHDERMEAWLQNLAIGGMLPKSFEQGADIAILHAVDDDMVRIEQIGAERERGGAPAECQPCLDLVEIRGLQCLARCRGAAKAMDIARQDERDLFIDTRDDCRRRAASLHIAADFLARHETHFVDEFLEAVALHVLPLMRGDGNFALQNFEDLGEIPACRVREGFQEFRLTLGLDEGREHDALAIRVPADCDQGLAQDFADDDRLARIKKYRHGLTAALAEAEHLFAQLYVGKDGAAQDLAPLRKLQDALVIAGQREYTAMFQGFQRRIMPAPCDVRRGCDKRDLAAEGRRVECLMRGAGCQAHDLHVPVQAQVVAACVESGMAEQGACLARNILDGDKGDATDRDNWGRGLAEAIEDRIDRVRDIRFLQMGRIECNRITCAQGAGGGQSDAPPQEVAACVIIVRREDCGPLPAQQCQHGELMQDLQSGDRAGL